MADKDYLQDMTPPGYTTVVIEPSRTGLDYPLYMKVEDVVEDQPAIRQEGIYMPRNEIETQNVVNFINESRKKEKLTPIGLETYVANQDNFLKYAVGQYQMMEEGKNLLILLTITETNFKNTWIN